MKKVLFFYLRHIFSISFFVFCIIEAFLNGWMMVLIGIPISAVAFAIEWVIRMSLPPTKKEMAEFEKKYCKGIDKNKKDDDHIDLFFVG